MNGMVEVDKGVLEKLILFSIAIVVLPLGLLYGSLHGYLDREALTTQLSYLDPTVHISVPM